MMPVLWHPTRWWGGCLSDDEKKETEPVFKMKLRCPRSVKNVFSARR